MSKPRVGGSYRYTGTDGLGQRARTADPEVPEDENALRITDGVNMAWLDMTPGTTVKVVGHDDDRDLVLVEWVDGANTTRITSVEPAEFEAEFEKES